MEKRTKIVATIGPASANYETLTAMVKNGMNIARLNFSHGSYDDFLAVIKLIKKVEKDTGHRISIMQDIQGPKIRLGDLPKEGVPVKVGQKVVFDFKTSKYADGIIPLPNLPLSKHLKKGHRMLIDDGHCEVVVEKADGSKFTCVVLENHVLKTHKGVNFPDTPIDISVLTPKDRADIRFGIQNGILDSLAVSFVHTAQDIRDVRNYISKLEKEFKLKPACPTFIISKLERSEAIDNLQEIMEETDGVMVARGDMAMEVSVSELPLIQKRIIDMANFLTKPVIVATQMLDSMQTSRRPTRAEITDVANAVIDHADALMLSNETAVGDHPAEVVRTMSEIIMATEKSEYGKVDMFHEVRPHKSISKAVAGISGVLATQVGANAVLVASATGKTGRLVARVRIPLPVYVGTESERACNQLCFSWGIHPFLLPVKKNVEDLVKLFITTAISKKYVVKGDRIVMLTGEPVGVPGSTNLIEVRDVK